MPSEAAFKVMDNLSKETQDASLLRLLKLYKRLPYPFTDRMVAGAIHKRKHQAVVRLLTEKIKHAAGTYPDRSFGVEADNKLKELLEKAEQIKRNMTSGIRISRWIYCGKSPLLLPRMMWISMFT